MSGDFIQTKPLPHCPKCAAWMYLKRPRDNHEWEPFWSCSRYPRCKATRDIDGEGKPVFDEDLDRGTQIVYVPGHARGYPDHNDIERGFVERRGNRPGYVVCRYWLKNLESLRTKRGGETTMLSNLLVIDSVPQEQVERALEEYCR